MSDIYKCGKVMIDFIEYLNLRYYTEDSVMVKSHIGFSLIMLKDLIELIECREDLPLGVYRDLNDVRFYNNQTEIEKLIIEALKDGVMSG